MESKLFQRSSLDRNICLSCGKKFGEHSRERSKKFNAHELMKCMFKIQASYVLETSGFIIDGKGVVKKDASN